MTEIERKAQEQIEAVKLERNGEVSSFYDAKKALCRAIEQHEAFRQEVSDAVAPLLREWPEIRSYIVERLSAFIIPKPDPLVEALTEAFSESGAWEPCDTVDADRLRAALTARGLKIVEDK